MNKLNDTIDIDKYWPQAVAHLQEPYDNKASDHVIIAEINEMPHNGYKGACLVRTALIPLELIDEILNAPGGIGYKVQSWGPHPCVRDGEVYETNFWIDGRKNKNERFQTIINSWNIHDQEVLLPDNVLLMTYGLVPRHLADGTVCWDDPQTPVYDVLRVKSHVNYSNKKDNPLGLITIRRDYLEDYCHIKACAAVAVFYEERFSSGDVTFEQVLNGQKGDGFELPGRLLGMGMLDDKPEPQMSRVWGTRLILMPQSRPITDAKDPELVWPGDTQPMTCMRAGANWAQGYVRDEVLLEYEAHLEYHIYPESGNVDYGGWWSIYRNHRVGRNHICVDLKKLYEGCPPHVIAHWHQFAVQKIVSDHDIKNHGSRNIAIRAKGILNAYLKLTKALECLSSRINAGYYTQEDIGTLASADITHHCWWSIDVMRPLYAVAPLTATREQFLERTVSLFKLLELLKQAPLRNIAIQLGIPKEQIKNIASLKLLAYICQFAMIAKEQGFSLPEDSDAIVPLWNSQKELPKLRSIFALNGLRVCQAHAPNTGRDTKIASAVETFGIDVTTTVSGWGYAIDTLYDRLADDLSEIALLIEDIE